MGGSHQWSVAEQNSKFKLREKARKEREAAYKARQDKRSLDLLSRVVTGKTGIRLIAPNGVKIENFSLARQWVKHITQ